MQVASCTLDASVKIYSCRVDSVHSDTYKVLGGLNRTDYVPENDEENGDDEQNGENQAGSDDEDQENGKSQGILFVLTACLCGIESNTRNRSYPLEGASQSEQKVKEKKKTKVGC